LLRSENAALLPIDGIECRSSNRATRRFFYSTAFLACVLPLYVRLIVVWTDRRLGRNHPPLPAG
jgi:hypothetical protein